MMCRLRRNGRLLHRVLVKADSNGSESAKQVSSMLMKPVLPTTKRSVICSDGDFRLYFHDDLFYAFRLVPFIWQHTVWQFMMDLLALIAPHPADDEDPLISSPTHNLPLTAADDTHLFSATGRRNRFCTSN